MNRKVIVRRRAAPRPDFQAMTDRAEGASLPYLDHDPAVAPPVKRRIVHRASRPSSRSSGEPSEMTRVVFGSLAPNVQPAVDWLGTKSGKKVLATGSVALGALVVTRLLNA
jgi:hypothetical protein